MRTRFVAVAMLAASCSEYDVVRSENVDVFFQEPAEAVDILMVVDNSCSMEPYQAELGQRFDEFIQFFIGADVDYHIGVTTTTIVKPVFDPDFPACSQGVIDEIPDAGQLVDNRVITASTENAAGVFDQIVNVGACGAGMEMGLEAARLALTEPLASTANFGFLREEAELSLIFVSDEEDFSPDPVNTYINDFRDVKGQRSREVFNASALTVTDLAGCGSASSVGDRYIDVAQQTRGLVGNLCDGDFAGIVRDLSLNASRLQELFYLSRTPDLRSLAVYVEEEQIACDAGVWTFEMADVDGVATPAVRFSREHLPETGQRITVRYNTGGGAEPFCGATEEVAP